ncbi:Alpha/Beta hydrolase protein [Podospora conica]|nr:Alpha/Beta hydrolase protein [Schizothecium conicum]
MPPTPPTPPSIPSPLLPSLTLIPPPPTSGGPPSTTTLLLLLHGLGDSPSPFATFARNLSLPGVFSIAIRGPSPLPPSLLGLPLSSGPTSNWHWGDDITLNADGDLDPDPGFERAVELVLREVVDGWLVGTCGWERGDVLVFGYGQGGTVALGVAGRAEAEGRGVKGVVSVGGGVVGSLMPSSSREGGTTPVMVCVGRGSEVDVEGVREVFGGGRVEVVRWEREGDGMPRSKEEMWPLMKWFGERLRF